MAMFQVADAQMQAVAVSSGGGDRWLSAEDFQDEEAARGAAASSQQERAEKRRGVGQGRNDYKSHDLEAELALPKLVLKNAQESRFLLSATFWNIEVATDGPLAQAVLQSGKQHHQIAVANKKHGLARDGRARDRPPTEHRRDSHLPGDPLVERLAQALVRRRLRETVPGEDPVQQGEDQPDVCADARGSCRSRGGSGHCSDARRPPLGGSGPPYRPRAQGPEARRRARVAVEVHAEVRHVSGLVEPEVLGRGGGALALSGGVAGQA